jgi:general secretion pathway protein G
MNYAPSSTQPGISLIEIMIAVTIMALFAALVGPTVYKYLATSKKTATQITLKGIQEAIETFHEHTGTYPNAISELYIRPAAEPVSKRWDGPYLGTGTRGTKPLDEDPRDAWKQEFVYQLNAKGTQPPYVLYSWGPNKEGSPQEEWIYP